jgi:hypothetical protein
MTRRAAWRVAGLLALALAGCGPKVDEPAPYEGALAGVDAPLDAITHRLSRVREHLRLRGYRELPRQGRVFVVDGQPVVLPIDLPGGACSTFVGLGPASLRDLRMTIFDAEGAPIATDAVPGEAGLVHVCPQTSAARMPCYLALEAREGAGIVGLAELTSAPAEGEGFEGVFDDVLAPREPFADVEGDLHRSETALRARGLARLGEPVIAAVAEGGSVRTSAQLEPRRCYVIVARAASTVRDADLFAFDGAGAEIARDIGAGNEPSIERCPAEHETITVEARAFAGGGALGVLVLAGPGHDEAAPEGVARALDPAGAPESADPSLALGVSAAALAPLGFAAPLFVAEHARIAPGDVVTHEAILGPGCSLVMAAASSDDIDLDLYLGDDRGRELDADTTVRSSATVRACEDAPTVRRIAVKAYGREGSYALAIVRAPESIDDVEGLRLAEAGAPLRARGFLPRETFDAHLEEGASTTRTTEVAAGHCIAVIAAGSRGVHDVDLRLVSTGSAPSGREEGSEPDARGAVLASDTAPAPFASASACAPAEQALTVTAEIVAFSGSGRVSISVMDDGHQE